MSYCVSYDVKYTDGLDKERSFSKNMTACFGSIFTMIDGEMPKKMEVSVYLFDTSHVPVGRVDYDHSLIFNEEELNQFFLAMDGIIDLPVIEQVDLSKSGKIPYTYLGGKSYKVTFNFDGKTPIYVKTALTYCRYTFENNDYMGALAKKAMEIKDSYPDVPFIEVFCCLHLVYKHANGGHSLMNFDSYGTPVSISSQETIIKTLASGSKNRVNSLFGLHYDNNGRYNMSSKPVTFAESQIDELITTFKRV